MKYNVIFRKTILLSFLISVCVAGNVLAEAEDLLNLLPGDCAFCVRINDLNGTLAKIDQYLAGVAPLSTAELVNTQLAGIVGGTSLKGIEMNGNFALVGLLDMQKVGLLVPVTNYANFVKTNPNCRQAEGGITILDSPMVDLAMTELADGKYALVVPQSQQNNLTALKTALTKTTGSLAGKLTADQVHQSVTAPVWAYVNLALLYNQFSPMILTKMEKVEQEMATEMGGGMEKFAGFFVKIYMEMFKQFAGDADSLSVSLTPAPTSLTTDILLRAKNGSELAQMLIANPKAKDGFTYTGYLDNDNAVNGLIKIYSPGMAKMYDKIFDILQKAKDDQSLAANITKMKKLTHKMLSAMGGEMAFSFSYAAGKPPFKFREVIAVSDMKTMMEIMNESMDMVGDFYAAMGIPMEFEYKANISSYKNTTIDKILITFPASGAPGNPMEDMMKKMYGSGLVYLLAHSGERFYVAMSTDNEADIKVLIDQNASAAATGETKAAIDLLQKTPYNDFVCSINVIKLMTGMGEMIKTIGQMSTGDNGKPQPMPNIFGGLNIPTQSSLAIGGQIADGQIGTRTILPKQHLMEIFALTMQIRQKTMRQQIPNQAQKPSQARFEHVTIPTRNKCRP